LSKGQTLSAREIVSDDAISATALSGPAGELLCDGLLCLLARLDVADPRAAYEAIRLANPGGLGQVTDQDVHDEPTQGLRAVMVLAADRNQIARQYRNGFGQVFDKGGPTLQ
jgi:triphosphoribosyl-dephospho-CoA synthase